MSECKASPGTMCAIRHFAGSLGIANLQSCVYCTFEPSGMVTVRGFIAGTIKVARGAGIKNHPVLDSVLGEVYCT